MTPLIVILVVLLLGIFAFVQVIIAKGWHSYLVAQSENIEATQRLRRFVRWFLMLGSIGWLVALVIMPDKAEVAVVGGGTLLLLGGALVLPLLARMGRISERSYIAARILLVPVVGGLIIFFGEALR